MTAALALSGARTLLVDADPQASALDWQAALKGERLFPVVGIAKPTLHKDVPGLAGGYKHIVIDGPPGQQSRQVGDYGRGTDRHPGGTCGLSCH